MIDFTNFLLRRQFPRNLDCVTDNDLKIALLCAVANRPDGRTRLARIWRPMLGHLWLRTAECDLENLYTRTNALLPELVDRGIVKVNRRARWHTIELINRDYILELRKMIELYNECA